MVECLECGADLAVPAGAEVGDAVRCPACGEAFVLVEVDPVEIDYPDDEDDVWAAEWDAEWDADLDADLDEDLEDAATEEADDVPGLGAAPT